MHGLALKGRGGGVLCSVFCSDLGVVFSVLFGWWIPAAHVFGIVFGVGFSEHVVFGFGFSEHVFGSFECSA